MANLTRTVMDAVLKQLYTYNKVSELAYKDHPLMAMMRKNETYGGRNYPIPFRYTRPQGISPTLSTAQSVSAASKFDAFLMTTVNNYGVARVDGEAIDTSKNDKHAFIQALSSEVNGIIKEVAAEAAKNIYRSSNGALGTVDSEVTYTLTLANTEDVHNFEVGMEIGAAYDSSGTWTPRDGGDTVTLTGINRNTGVLTSDDDWGDTITDIAADDILHRKGALNNYMSGLQDWLPDTAPSSGESFFGVDRSVDSKLFGIYHDGSSSSIEDALIDGQSKACVNGGMPSIIMINNKNYRELVKALSSKVEYDTSKVAQSAKGKMAQIGFRGMVVEGDHGPLTVMADRDCPVNTAFALDLPCWQILSSGQIPQIMDHDGNRILRMADQDAYEVRIVYRANTACDFPGANARILLPS
jgi:hypothetical protein